MKQRILAMLLFGLLGITPALAQEREITGKVTDSKGESIPGVAVLVVETNTGNATDIDGNFKVKAATGNTLRFSYVNFKTKEVKVGAETNVSITLEDDNMLTDVIVTGYRNEDAATYTGSAAKVGTKEIAGVPIATFDQVLQGRVAGLQASAGSGQPGDPATVRIRGIGSLNGNNAPLYIVDGIPVASGDFASINANDFESMTVLKDATSTSKYGSRGSNGVIVVKTKTGTSGKTKLNYGFQQGITNRTTAKISVMNTPERLEFERMLAETDVRAGTNTNATVKTNAFWRTWIAAGRPSSGPAYDLLQSQLAPFRAVNTNWNDLIFQTGQFQSHDLSATGGNEKTNFFVSGQYRKEEGIIKNSLLDRYTLRFNVNHNVTDKFRFGLNASIGYSKKVRTYTESVVSAANPVLGVYSSLPYITPETDRLSFALNFNPIVTMDNTRWTQNNYKTIAGLYLEYDISKSFSIRTTWGGDLSLTNEKEYVRPTDIQNTLAAGQPGGAGYIFRQMELDNSFVGTTTLNYNKSFGEDNKHRIIASANFELVARAFSEYNLVGYAINPKTVETLNGASGAGLHTVGGTNTHNRLTSIFADASYTFNNKYTVSTGVRRDGSSRFGANKRYGTFYSMGATWNVDKEPFMENIANILPEAKLRVTYGEQGNQPTVDFGYLPTFATAATFNYGGAPGIAPSVPANEDYKWESQAVFNIGFDFGFWKQKNAGSRIRGTVEYYNRKTTDLILNAPISRTTGFDALAINTGSMQNRGVELNLTVDVLRLKDFTWTVNAVHTLNRNKVLSLGTATEFLTNLNRQLRRPGLPVDVLYPVNYAGVNPANGDPLYYDKDNNITNVYSATNAQVSNATPYAPHFGSFTNTFSFKGFELSAFFVYEIDKFLYNDQAFLGQNMAIARGEFNRDVRMLNAWMTPGQVTEVPRLNAAVANDRFTSRFIEDVSFLRLRNVMLSYDVPSRWLNSAKVRSLRVYFSGQNLLTFTKYTGFDPEDNNDGTGGAQYPVPRVYSVGLNLGF